MNKMRNKHDSDLEQLNSYLDGELSASDTEHIKTLLQSEPDIARELEEIKTIRTILREIPRPALPRDFTLSPADVVPKIHAGETTSGRTALPRHHWRRSFIWVPAIMVIVGIAGYLTHWFGAYVPVKSSITLTETGSEPDNQDVVVSAPSEFLIELPPGRALAPEIDDAQSDLHMDTSCLEPYYTGETFSDEITGRTYHLYDLEGIDYCKVCPNQCVTQTAEGQILTPSEILIDSQGSQDPVGTKSTEAPQNTSTEESDPRTDRDLTDLIPETTIASLNTEFVKDNGTITIAEHGRLYFQHQTSISDNFMVKVTFDNPSVTSGELWWSYGISFGDNNSDFIIFRLSSDNTWELSDNNDGVSTGLISGYETSLTSTEADSNTLILLVSDRSFMAWVNGSPIETSELPTIRTLPGEIWLTAAIGNTDGQPMRENRLSVEFRNLRVWDLNSTN